MRSLSCMLLLTLAFTLAASPSLTAQTKKVSGLDRIEGTIHSLDQEKGSMEVRQRNRANMVWTILYTDKTAITYRNEDAAAEDLKVGRRVIALGRFAEDSIKMKALRIDIRTGR